MQTCKGARGIKLQKEKRAAHEGCIQVCIRSHVLKENREGARGGIEFIFSNDNDTEHIGAVIVPCVVLFR